jgi:polysaccharide biosynthesis protein PslH
MLRSGNMEKNQNEQILYISSCMEHPAVGGPQLRVETSIKALTQICDLHVCNATHLSYPVYERTMHFYAGICRHVSALPSADMVKNSTLLMRISRRLRRLIGWRSNSVKADADFIAAYVSKYEISIVWFGHATGGLYTLMKKLKRLNPSLRFVCDTDSVWSQFILRGLPYAHTEDQRLDIQKKGLEKEAEERDWVNCSSIITAVSEVDADYYRRLAKFSGQVYPFSNVIDITSYQQTPPQSIDLKKPCMYLAGTFWHQSPMEDAARWVVQEVLPLVRQKVPAVHLYIIGRGSADVLSDINDPGITITGKLLSVLPYLCYADVVLVPLRFESGTRFKILEAGACGVPVVSTTLGAEGLMVTHEQDILIADGPADFAGAVVRLIGEHKFAGRLASSLRKLVEEKYSVPSLVEEGRHILKELRCSRNL